MELFVVVKIGGSARCDCSFFLDPSGTPAKSCCVAGKQLLDNNSLCFIPGQGPSIQREQSSRAQLAVVGRYDWKSCTAKVESVMKSALQPFSLLRCRKALREACQHRKAPEEPSRAASASVSAAKRMDVRRGAQQGSLSVSLGSRASTALPHYSSWRRFLC